MDEVANETPGLKSRVIRIGQTVSRPVHKNSPAVHALLKHLEELGFEGAPRTLGLDKYGRETVNYINGTAGHYPLKPYVLSESTLVRLGFLLRRFHDATTGFSLPKNVVWHNPVAEPSKLLTHSTRSRLLRAGFSKKKERLRLP